MFAVATTVEEASGNIPAAPISLPEGSWKQVLLFFYSKVIIFIELLQSL